MNTTVKKVTLRTIGVLVIIALLPFIISVIIVLALFITLADRGF